MIDNVEESWSEADEAIEEVREIRRRISARFNHDPSRLVEHYMHLQTRHADRLIDRRTVRERKWFDDHPE